VGVELELSASVLYHCGVWCKCFDFRSSCFDCFLFVWLFAEGAGRLRALPDDGCAQDQGKGCQQGCQGHDQGQEVKFNKLVACANSSQRTRTTGVTDFGGSCVGAFIN